MFSHEKVLQVISYLISQLPLPYPHMNLVELSSSQKYVVNLLSIKRRLGNISRA